MKSKQNQFKKTEKKIEALEVLKPEQNKKEIKWLGEIFPKAWRTNEINNELDEIKK